MCGASLQNRNSVKRKTHLAFLWRDASGVNVPNIPKIGKGREKILHMGQVSFLSCSARNLKKSPMYMTKNDATEDLYFGVKRDTAKPEKWHNARHRTPRVGKK